jgi:hypothetical protein
MSELRSRMIRDVTVRGFSPQTHEAYIRQVVGLARHYRRAPDSSPPTRSRPTWPTCSGSGSGRGARAPRPATRSGSSTT